MNLLITQNRQGGEIAIAQALQPLFTQCNQEDGKVLYLLKQLMENKDQTPRLIVAIVERLVLPEKIKQNLLPYVYRFIAPSLVKVDQGGEVHRVTGVHITINLETLFGTKDFVQHPESVPTLLAKSLAWHVRTTGLIAVQIPSASSEGTLGDGIVG